MSNYYVTKKTVRKCLLLIVAIVAMSSIFADAYAQEPIKQNTDGVYAEAFKVLFVVFILAILLESGLSVIFNWRPFLQNCDARGVKTIVSVSVACLFTAIFNLDMATDLVNVYSGTNHPSNVPGRILTAFIIAGGSSGVNNLLVALGFRSVLTAERIAPKPPPTEAWLAVRLKREEAVGPVMALIGPDGTTLPVAGTIVGKSQENAVLRYFLADHGRFPVVGGYKIALETGKQYAVQLSGVDKEHKQLHSPKWGPHLLAPGAIIDIEMRL